jgi:EAL domain-containing protein (putative c-di-GMP-specific phosphodiesterase class I)
VIAEGVETEDQLKLLQLLRCDEIQGFFFSKPLPAETLVTLFDSRSERSLDLERS